MAAIPSSSPTYGDLRESGVAISTTARAVLTESRNACSQFGVPGLRPCLSIQTGSPLAFKSAVNRSTNSLLAREYEMKTCGCAAAISTFLRARQVKLPLLYAYPPNYAH